MPQLPLLQVEIVCELSSRKQLFPKKKKERGGRADMKREADEYLLGFVNNEKAKGTIISGRYLQTSLKYAKREL